MFRKSIKLLVASSFVFTTSLVKATEAAKNPFQQTIDGSVEVNKTFNSFFQQSLNESQSANSAPGSTSDRYSVEKYVLGLPSISGAGSTNQGQANGDCDLNKADYLYRPENLYSKIVGNSDTNQSSAQGQSPTMPATLNKPFSPLANKAYCEMQRQFNGMAIADFNRPAVENLDQEYVAAKERLKKKDTLVVVIPGIFGEFIDQVAFGEVFGQGLAKLAASKNNTDANSANQSTFAESFHQFLEDNKENPEVLKLIADKRFLVKNLQNYDSNNKQSVFSEISVDEWIRVSSVEDSDGATLYKVAVLGLEPMSLESLGKQEELALIYGRRLIKFMELYKMQAGRYPTDIIVAGYSRGTPVAQEMLAIMNKGPRPQGDQYLKSKMSMMKRAEPWIKNVKAAVSLGGVVLGSSLGDESVVYRQDAPLNVLLLQKLKSLLTRLEIISLDDVKSAEGAFAKAGKRNRVGETMIPNARGTSIRWKTIDLKADEDVKKALESLTTKVGKNLKEIQKFKEFIKGKVDSTTITPEQRQALQEILKVLSVVDNFNQMPLSLKTVEELKEFLTDIKGVPAALMSLREVIEKSSKLLPDFMGIKELLYKSSQLAPDVGGMSEFNKKIMENFGFFAAFDAAKKSLEKPTLGEKLKALAQVNNLVKYFVYFFDKVWDGASELGTIPRLSWLAENAGSLPTHVTYYSLIGVLQSKDSQYYKDTLNYGFNTSADQEFLNGSWANLSNVGSNESHDGLDLTFAGSKINDSQVDWYKTILWPHVLGALSEGNVKVKTKILGILKTHHWGLALPFAFLNKTNLDPITGHYREDNSKVDNVNPFPRADLLKAAVMAIETDSQK